MRDCEGPATSLPAELLAALEPRKDYHPDHVWADIAERVPGGFAGIMAREGQPILLLTDPSQVDAAKEALVPLISGFPIRDASVEQARWDFSQLVNWYDYLSQHTPIHTFRMTFGDKSEGDNRIVYGWADSASLYAARDMLEALPVPCRLVLLEIMPPARALPGLSDH